MFKLNHKEPEECRQSCSVFFIANWGFGKYRWEQNRPSDDSQNLVRQRKGRVESMGEMIIDLISSKAFAFRNLTLQVSLMHGLLMHLCFYSISA